MLILRESLLLAKRQNDKGPEDVPLRRLLSLTISTGVASLHKEALTDLTIQTGLNRTLK